MKITLTTAQAVALAKGIAPAISTDTGKPNLHSIQVTTTGEYATFTATDGYRLHRITVPQTDIDPIPTFQVGGVELVGALLIAAKATGKGINTVELLFEHDGKVIVTGTGVSSNVPVMNVDFPACASILDIGGETESGASYDTVYLAEMVTAAGHISGKSKVGAKYLDHGQLVKIENIHPKKPMHVTAQSVATGIQFHGVLMPRRAS
jgi:DNA polymerase III sliding clamp (beta) subunit (PCNA family)